MRAGEDFFGPNNDSPAELVVKISLGLTLSSLSSKTLPLVVFPSRVSTLLALGKTTNSAGEDLVVFPGAVLTLLGRTTISSPAELVVLPTRSNMLCWGRAC